MTRNTANSRRFRQVRTTMDQFDALPRAWKELIWYAPLQLAAPRVTTDAPSQMVLLDMRQRCAQACRDTYGPNHPQAAMSTARSAAELDF